MQPVDRAGWLSSGSAPTPVLECCGIVHAPVRGPACTKLPVVNAASTFLVNLLVLACERRIDFSRKLAGSRMLNGFIIQKGLPFVVSLFAGLPWRIYPNHRTIEPQATCGLGDRGSKSTRRTYLFRPCRQLLRTPPLGVQTPPPPRLPPGLPWLLLPSARPRPWQQPPPTCRGS